MALNRQPLQKQLESIFSTPSPTFPVPGARIAAAYAAYASTAQSCRGVIAPMQAQLKQGPLAAALTSIFATGHDYVTTFTHIADAFAAFWLAPPIAFLGPTPGLVIAAPAEPLRTALIYGFSQALTLIGDDTFSVSPGQTEFTLSLVPSGGVSFILNGMTQNPSDFTVVGQLVTWTSLSVTLEPGDFVELTYMTSSIDRGLSTEPGRTLDAAQAASHWAGSLDSWAKASVVVSHPGPSACIAPIS